MPDTAEITSEHFVARPRLRAAVLDSQVEHHRGVDRSAVPASPPAASIWDGPRPQSPSSRRSGRLGSGLGRARRLRAPHGGESPSGMSVSSSAWRSPAHRANNAIGNRLLDLCGVTQHAPIGDADGLYHPAVFNDRLISVSRAPCPRRVACAACALERWYPQQSRAGGIASGPAGRLRVGDEAGEIRFHPDEAVTTTIRTVFDRFAGWFRPSGLALVSRQDLRFPSQSPRPITFVG